MTSKFGNPVWKSDDDFVTLAEWNARLQGLKEAYRIVTGPSVMSNNPSFQHAIDCCTDLIKRRIDELEDITRDGQYGQGCN